MWLYSAKIGDKDVLEDFGCYVAHVDISAPTAKIKRIDIPLRNGSLDVTELLTDEVKYEDRTIKITLAYGGENYEAIYSDVVNYCHGKRMMINLGVDPMYYYTGRLEVQECDKKKYGGLIKIEATCDPFKYTMQSSNEEWEWDNFDFEEGYINELSNIPVDGTKTITLIADEKLTFARITSNAQMNVTYSGKTVIIGVGTTTLYDFEFKKGNNVITIQGTGTISINYRGGRL